MRIHSLGRLDGAPIPATPRLLLTPCQCATSLEIDFYSIVLGILNGMGYMRPCRGQCNGRAERGREVSAPPGTSEDSDGQISDSREYNRGPETFLSPALLCHCIAHGMVSCIPFHPIFLRLYCKRQSPDWWHTDTASRVNGALPEWVHRPVSPTNGCAIQLLPALTAFFFFTTPSLNLIFPFSLAVSDNVD